AAVPSIESLVLNFQRTVSLSGREELATPVCNGLPRKMGQSLCLAGLSAITGVGLSRPRPRALRKNNIAKEAVAIASITSCQGLILDTPTPGVKVPVDLAPRQIMEEHHANSTGDAWIASTDEYRNQWADFSSAMWIK